MIFPTTAILAVVALLVTPVLSAPIHVKGGSGALTSHPVDAGLEKRSPMFWGHPHQRHTTTILERDVQEYGNLVARDESSTIEARSLQDTFNSPLAKREEGEPMRLVRRKSVLAKMKEGFKKAGAAIKKGFQKAGSAIKKGFQKVGNGIKTAAKKVGNFVKTTGAKIAKFGLKVWATATKVAGHVASLIPGVGKPIGKALGAASKVANLASDKIKANLGKKLEKGMKVMNKIQHPVGGAAGKVLEAILKRDLNEEYLVERDIPQLETRSFEDGEWLEARSFGEEDIEARSFDEVYGLEARSLGDLQELEARSWDFEESEA